ncbi:MAG: ATP-binding cassette domain-containing protein [Methanobacterium sp.]|uniref:ABC transporter ATP-binding protein n=1 Tax=Methanobacterium sp. TaxID=2164 RepID=UPI0025F64BDE|nr:ATP-binding cassette domain-containing protein [Methanobacterium sp.]MDY9923217.1 ATP-binding cassette domain-containing protein [Methanobacterium sp.]
MVDEFIIEANNLFKSFGDFVAVDNLNLKIKKGEVFGFLGPNGAGKTTSIKMMVGLLRPTGGQILVDGKDIAHADRLKIGICPQDIVLWESLTCKESLKFMGEMYEVPEDVLKTRVESLLEDLILMDKANTLVSNLSGGMKRRLNLAMALIHSPEIVVLDEPSEGLDPQSRRVLWNFIRSLRDNEGKTVILTTHLMDEADGLSDRIAIIDHGKLLRLDTPKNLKNEFGDGDIVEIHLADPKMNQEVIYKLKTMETIDSVTEVDGKINIRTLNAVGKLPEIMNKVQDMNTEIADLSLHPNTLEDVFIELTGTSLRE